MEDERERDDESGVAWERDRDHDGPPGPPARNGGDVGVGDGILVPGDPNLEYEGDIALRCPESGCRETGWAVDYRKAYWPNCPRHRFQMILADH
jgi:hypothetical protein